MRSGPLVVGIGLLFIATPDQSRADGLLLDRFGRTIDERGAVLVDWEGHLANPAIELFVQPPEALPAVVTLGADHERLYFDDPSTVGAGGPGKTFTITTSAPRAFKVSIFPDRDGEPEVHALEISVIDGQGSESSISVPLIVVDQDAAATSTYPMTVDYGEDQSGFYELADRRAVLETALADWAFFLADMDLDPVPAGAQSTWIWDWPLAWTGPPPNGGPTSNSTGYAGYLLYTYGINTPQLRSGGAPSTCCFHHRDGAVVPLRRSGAVSIEIAGNYNTLGWFLTEGPDDWWVSANLGNEPNDLYSIAHHEIGHALAFNSGYPGFQDGEESTFTDPAVFAYFGGPVAVNSTFDHFQGVVDPASGRGIFGNEYGGIVPRRRWLITKLDLLLMQAIGYELRETSAFRSLAAPSSQTLPAGRPDEPYEASLAADGGIPFYDWTLADGLLPPGLELDRFTGTISGTPAGIGVHAFSVRVRDYDLGPGVLVDVSIVVEDPCPADTNGDDLVDVDDLVHVLLMFGGDDPAADIDRSGVVDVDDLVGLLLAWGPCVDCNANGIPDADDVAGGTSVDCDGDSVPDECEPDCNGNAVADDCDVAFGASADCNGNFVPDECDIEGGADADCNGNGVPDACDIADGTSFDIDGDGIPDDCDPTDCNGNGVPDLVDIATGTSADCGGNFVPDECETDCNCNGIDDAKDIASGASADCHGDGIPDECQAPTNDGCGTAVTLVGNAVSFSTCGAGSVGPEEPGCPVLADVWFRTLAACDGPLTVTVEADFAAVIAVYAGPCPSEPGGMIACGEGEVSVDATAGTLYRFRVGSADGSTGSGTLDVSCAP
ncbi:MAG: Ig domain-containing protein [Planctomycetota bacterium]